MSHVTHMNESHHTYRQWTAITPAPHLVMSMSTAMSHVAHMDAPRHTYSVT